MKKTTLAKEKLSTVVAFIFSKPSERDRSGKFITLLIVRKDIVCFSNTNGPNKEQRNIF